MAHVRARVGDEDDAVARAILPHGAWLAFAAMPVADRRHGLDVVARLTARGEADPRLLAAALLHDAGKGSRMRLWHRVGAVLLEAVSPRLVGRIGSPDAASWRYPFWLYVHHAELSADLAERAGCSPTTVRLISGEPADDEEARLLALLEAADDAS